MNNPSSLVPFPSSIEDAPAYWQEDILWIVLASSEQTGGAYSLIEEFCPKDSGPPPHYHDQDEGFHLVTGEITFRAGDQTIKAKDGFFVSIPRGTVHSFRVDSETAHILNFYTPAGFEKTVMKFGQPAKTRSMPSKGIDKPIDPEEIKVFFKQIGMYVVDEPNSLHSSSNS